MTGGIFEKLDRQIESDFEKTGHYNTAPSDFSVPDKAVHSGSKAQCVMAQTLLGHGEESKAIPYLYEAIHGGNVEAIGVFVNLARIIEARISQSEGHLTGAFSYPDDRDNLRQMKNFVNVNPDHFPQQDQVNKFLYNMS